MATDPVEPVVWRGGVHLAGTPLWCDAARPRDVCFVSRAGDGEVARHGQLIATRATLALLARRDRRARPRAELAVPYGRPFTLGTLRLELFRSGSAPGGASLLVDRGGERIAYAGAINPGGGGLGGAADVRPCDTLVVDAGFGHPRFAFPPVEDEIARLRAFARDALDAGRAPVLLVASAGKGVDVAYRLADLAVPLRAHRAIHRAAQRLRAEGEPVPPIRRLAGAARPGEIALWLQRRGQPAEPVAAAAAAGATCRVALVSGWAADPGEPAAWGAEVGFAWSSAADYPSLVRYIAATGAARVYATGRFADALAAQLDGDGLRVRALAPPRQLQLFPA